MKERPILFNAEMVRAILDGRKTQTRRPIKPQPTGWNPATGSGVWEDAWWFCVAGDMDYSEGPFRSPFGAPGDRLWVRETWVAHEVDMEWDCEIRLFFRADDPGFEADGGWRPSIHMPRRASRITLEVERAWAERVNEISYLDALAEGIYRYSDPWGCTYTWDHTVPSRYNEKPQRAFKQLWNSIYAKRGFGWDTNCWTFGCEFNVLEVTR